MARRTTIGLALPILALLPDRHGGQLAKAAVLADRLGMSAKTIANIRRRRAAIGQSPPAQGVIRAVKGVGSGCFGGPSRPTSVVAAGAAKAAFTTFS